MLSLPRDLLLTESIAKEALDDFYGMDVDLYDRLYHDCTALDSALVMVTLFVVLLRSGETLTHSRWEAYAKELPIGQDLLVNLHDLHVLRRFPRLKDRLEKLQEDAQRVYMSFGLKQEMNSSQEWLDALAVTAGRLHHVWIWRKWKWVKEAVLVPLADMMNTDFQENINVECFTNRMTQDFDCIALRK